MKTFEEWVATSSYLFDFLILNISNTYLYIYIYY